MTLPFRFRNLHRPRVTTAQGGALAASDLLDRQGWMWVAR